MEKGEALKDEERQALALLVLLIEVFEQNVQMDDDEDGGDDGEGPPAPHIALQRLMQSHQLDLNDIAPIFGNPHIARAAIDGTRPISRAQAKELGRYFRVPAKLFRED
jgi:antitoxin component HigA of HigAB toxin-antitoxin module